MTTPFTAGQATSRGARALHEQAEFHGWRRWGLILAGGEGVRLRPITRAITGTACPKQFCALLGGVTLLEQTRRRAALVIPPARNLVVLTRAHEPFYRPLLPGIPPHCRVIQPADRGTAAAIMYGLCRVATVAPLDSVAILPSDHWVSNDAGFMRHVAAAFAAVEMRPDLVVLLGITPESAESQYGWIEPAEAIPGTALLRASRFVEKPSPHLAQTLRERGGLWNSFVVVGAIPAFLSLIRHAAPDVASAFETAAAVMGTAAESVAVRELYARLRPASFSDRVLACGARNLAILPVVGVQWSDWGSPERALTILERLGAAPEWAERLGLTARPPARAS